MGSRVEPRKHATLIAELLDSKRVEMGISFRQLDEMTGIEFTRLRRALNASRPLTVDDFVDVCRALGLRASTVLREVEAELHTPALPPEWELAALDVDPRTLDGGLDPARGEEPQ